MIATLDCICGLSWSLEVRYSENRGFGNVDMEKDGSMDRKDREEKITNEEI